MRPKMRWGVASYRDAIKLLLTWFKDTERIPPEKLRLIDIDRPRVLRFLDWLEAERGCSTATRNQRLAVIIRGALLPALPHDPAPRAPEGPQRAGVVVPAGESCGVDVLGPGVPVAGAVGQCGERGP
jgi:integrase